MANRFQIEGAQSSKPSRYVPLWTNSFFQGLITQRSVLRAGMASHNEEKYYGAQGDALIDGSNVELTNRLTMARRPGNSSYNSATFGSVSGFYSFRYYDGVQEQIKVIVDTASAVYNGTGSSTQQVLYAKGTTDGAATFKSVGSTLFFGTGGAAKKWLTSAPWKAATAYTTGQFLVDANNNVQLVTAGGTSGTTEPTWSAFYGTTVTDGATVGGVTWKCFCSAVANWGIAKPTNLPTNSSGGSTTCRYWSPNTTLTSGYAILDSNGNVQVLNDSAQVNDRSVPTTGSVLTGSTGDGHTWDTSTTSNAALAYDGSMSSCAVIDDSGKNYSAPIYWSGFPAVTGAYHKVLSVTASMDNNPAGIAFVSYSLDAGTTGKYLVFYAQGVNSVGAVNFVNVNKGNSTTPQTLTVPLPDGQDLTKVLIEGFAGTAVLKVYDVHIDVTVPVGTGTSTALKTGSSLPKWSTSLYGVTVDGNVYWVNHGRIMSWTAGTVYSVAGPTGAILDSDGNLQIISTTGQSASTPPTWDATLGHTTTDGSVVWKNAGLGTPMAFTGWQWAYAYHCVDGHVSTASPISLSTGPALGVMSIPLTGQGSYDPQCDAIWLFRTVDGGATLCFIDSITNPGGGSTWSYTDAHPDDDVNIFLQAAIASDNDPPPANTVAPEYHLGRMFIASGHTVFYSQGYTSVGSAVQSFPPLNYFVFPSTVTRMVSTPSGVLVFTVSDVYMILGNGVSSPLYAVAFIRGMGLLHYYALTSRNSIPALFTSDGQFVEIMPDGVNELGANIGDKWYGLPSKPSGVTSAGLASFNPATAYVTWHVDGSQDKAYYIGDGSTGWYRCNPTPTPERGPSWSPFATIVGGCSAVQSIETAAGVHKLLVGGVGAAGTITTGQLGSGSMDTFTRANTAPGAGIGSDWTV